MIIFVNLTVINKSENYRFWTKQTKTKQNTISLELNNLQQLLKQGYLSSITSLQLYPSSLFSFATTIIQYVNDRQFQLVCSYPDLLPKSRHNRARQYKKKRKG